jgi:hypothetical protein
VSGPLGVAYAPNQMSYDLARLRLNGLIERCEGTNTYLTTAEGQRVAVFYTKIYNRLLRQLLAADSPPAPAQLRAALRTIDRQSTATSTTRTGNGRIELKINVKEPYTKGSLRRARDFARERWPLRGSSGHLSAAILRFVDGR